MAGMLCERVRRRAREGSRGGSWGGHGSGGGAWGGQRSGGDAWGGACGGEAVGRAMCRGAASRVVGRQQVRGRGQVPARRRRAQLINARAASAFGALARRRRLRAVVEGRAGSRRALERAHGRVEDCARGGRGRRGGGNGEAERVGVVEVLRACACVFGADVEYEAGSLCRGGSKFSS